MQGVMTVLHGNNIVADFKSWGIEQLNYFQTLSRKREAKHAETSSGTSASGSSLTHADVMANSGSQSQNETERKMKNSITTVFPVRKGKSCAVTKTQVPAHFGDCLCVNDVLKKVGVKSKYVDGWTKPMCVNFMLVRVKRSICANSH